MEKPILFNTEMVKAILEGGKTQTRRAIRNIRAYHMDGTPGKMPPWKPGDVLYVRETWSWMNAMDCGSPCIGPCKQYKGEYGCFIYKATNNIFTDGWNPSIHMPREAARLFLKVKDVRLERLRDVFFTDSAAILEVQKEGVDIGETCRACIEHYGYPCCIDADDDTECVELDNPRYVLSKLWDSTIKPVEIDRFGWAANPWVWVIEFEKMEGYHAGK